MARRFKLKKIIKIGRRALRKGGIPLYWSKYSRKDFTIHQHIIILVLAQYFKRGVQYVLDLIDEIDELKKALGLKKVPDESTISKEKKRIPEEWIEMIIREIAKIMGISGKVAVDSTGIRMSHKSFHYTIKIGGEKKIRVELKMHTALDIENQLMLNVIPTKFYVNDSPYLIPLLKNIKNLDAVYGDKAYDANRNIKFIIGKGATPYISIRNNAKRGLRKKYLLQSQSEEWKKEYSHRNVIESSFHSFKSVVGDYVFARSFESAFKSLLFKVLAYNLYI